jgi:hypothetical protein
MKTKDFIALVILIFLTIPFYTCKKELEETILVSTGTCENLGNDSVILNGQIIDPGTGIKQYGHCWNKTGNPDINSDTTDFGARTVAGSFQSKATGLEANTTYYYVAYASDGLKSIYGKTNKFTTQIASPVVTTAESSQ